MDLSTQKRMAADVLDCGKNKVRIREDRQEEVADAITKADIRRLVQEGAVYEKRSKGQSRDKARKIQKQKDKGRRKGHGSRKGKSGAGQSQKEKWISKVRAQRKLLKSLKDEEKISQPNYRELYKKTKGGYFSSKKNLKDYIRKNNMLRKGEEIE